MSQIYLNRPSMGLAMSAEEYTAAVSRQSDAGCGCGGAGMSPENCGCGCGETDCDCPETCHKMICTCCPVTPTPKPPQVDEGCCCKQSFRAALGLLCDGQTASLLDFDEAAFITSTYTAGTTLSSGGRPSSAAGEPAAQADEGTGDGTGDAADAGTTGKPTPPAPPCPGGQSDNLGDLEGSFLRFTPCTCDLLDIDAELYTAGGKKCAFAASQVSLCELDAVAIQGASACPESGMDAGEVAARNFRRLRQRLAQRLNPCGACGETPCSCDCDGRDCCCAAGLLGSLAQNNLSRRVSLAAGLLILQNVTLLGTVGSVLVLANDTSRRLYFVCVNSVQFIG